MDAVFLGIQHEGFISFRWHLPKYRIVITPKGASLETESETGKRVVDPVFQNCLHLYGTQDAVTVENRKTRLWVFNFTRPEPIRVATALDPTMKTLANQFTSEHIVVFTEHIVPHFGEQDYETQ